MVIPKAELGMATAHIYCTVYVGVPYTDYALKLLLRTFDSFFIGSNFIQLDSQ